MAKTKAEYLAENKYKDEWEFIRSVLQMAKEIKYGHATSKVTSLFGIRKHKAEILEKYESEKNKEVKSFAEQKKAKEVRQAAARRRNEKKRKRQDKAVSDFTG